MYISLVEQLVQRIAVLTFFTNDPLGYFIGESAAYYIFDKRDFSFLSTFNGYGDR